METAYLSTNLLVSMACMLEYPLNGGLYIQNIVDPVNLQKMWKGNGNELSLLNRVYTDKPIMEYHSME